jgi:2,5-diamino-6-(ribosylamino)-4(3H)-pyrimidinone 5'-phosphate reductase
MNKPYTTLFLLMSVDGKISTGDTEEMDVDKDYPKIPGLKEGLQQYYDVEKTTDYYSLNSGRVWAKIGFNEKTDMPTKVPVVFVVIDNKPHLKETGIRYVSKKCEMFILVTTNSEHLAFSLKSELGNIEILKYEDRIDFTDMFAKLKNDFGAERVTIQTGGTLNAELIRAGLVDRLLLVVAPALIGGKDTSTLVDGESLHTIGDINKIKTLELVQAKPLENSYLLLEYNVKN